jgi:hypothetical protein
MIESFDFAVEGFIFLAGYMLGSRYLPRFVVDSKGTSIRLLTRVAKLVIIQFIMIITISLPFYAFISLKGTDSVARFFMESMLFQNQVPILHILPTFIPLFLAAPLMLLLVAENHVFLLALCSAVLFWGGDYDPFQWWGTGPAIFPLFLWQVYFVGGIIIGAKSLTPLACENRRMFIIAAVIFLASFLIKFGGAITALHSIKVDYNIYVKKFPLNLYGLLFGASLLAFVATGVLRFWAVIERMGTLVNGLTLLGRNSLAVFIVHAYFIYCLDAANRLGMPMTIIYVLIGGTLVATYSFASVIDKKCQTHDLPKVFRWLLT